MSKQTKFVKDEEIKIRKAIPLKEAEDIVNDLITLNDAWCEKIEVVGSIRRQKSIVNDIDFVVLTTDKKWESLRENMGIAFYSKKVLGGSKILRYLVPDIQVDFYRATEDTYGILKLVRTGSAEHNIWLARYAIYNKGMRLLYSQGLTKDSKVIAGKTEEGVFEALGLKYIAPSLREIVDGKPVWLK